MRSRGCISSQKQVPVWEHRRALGEREEVYPSNKLKTVYSAWCPQQTEDCVLKSDAMNCWRNVKKCTPPTNGRLCTVWSHELMVECEELYPSTKVKTVYSVWCPQQTADCVLSLMPWTVGGMWRSVPLQQTKGCVLLCLMPWTNWRLCTQSDPMNCWGNVKKYAPQTNWRLCTQSDAKLNLMPSTKWRLCTQYDAMNKLKTVYSIWCHELWAECEKVYPSHKLKTVYSVWCHELLAECEEVYPSNKLKTVYSVWCHEQTEDCVLSLMPSTNWRLCTQSDAMNCWRNAKRCTPPTNWRLYSVWCHELLAECKKVYPSNKLNTVLSLMPWTVGGMQKGVPL